MPTVTSRFLLPTLLTCLLPLGQAHGEMQALDNSSLSAIAGQAGITLTLDLKTEAAKISWEDDGGSLQLRNLQIDNGCAAPGDCPVSVAYGPAKLYFNSALVNAPTLQVDVVDQGGTQKLQMALPDLKTTSDQLLADGLITTPLTIRMRLAADIGVGDAGAPGSSTLGRVEIRDLSNLQGQLRIWGH